MRKERPQDLGDDGAGGEDEDEDAAAAGEAFHAGVDGCS